jgi:hypothetical protein
MGEMINAWQVLENVKRSDHFQDLGIDRMILKWILKKYRVGGVDWSSSEWELVFGSCEHGNKPFGSTEDSKFSD